MPKLLFIFCSGVFLFFYICTSSTPPSGTEQVKQHLLAQFDSLEYTARTRLLRLSQQGATDSLPIAFHQVRRGYKKIEWFTEYYAPGAAKELNGAPLPEIEVEETRIFPPSGLQVIEEQIYPSFTPDNRAELVREVKAFLSSLKRARNALEQTTFAEAHLIDAAKQEVYRVLVLGISGFDTPLSQTGVAEAAVTLQSLQQTLTYLGENKELRALFTAAIQYTQQHSDFDTFDRLTFITRFANPLTTRLTQWQKSVAVNSLPGTLALNPAAPTLFSPQAINPNYFTGNPEARLTPKKIALGKALFFSPIISGGARTCATCHQPGLAFTDGLPRSAALTAGKTVLRNAPTLLYAGLQTAQFYDMRAPTLENQAMDVMANQEEMHASVEAAAARLSKLPAYQAQFKAAFPNMEAEVKPRYVMIALASYIRSLTPFNSRFDQHLRGNSVPLTALEKTGFNLFMGKAKCGTCHFMPVFNGTAPPTFASSEAEVLGVPTRPATAGAIIDPDQGRYVHTQIPELKFAFKTPTLRNIALTAPYMHNGVFNTLEEVIDFYDNGGGAGLNLDLPHQTLPTEKLNLTSPEKRVLKAFLMALTDSSFIPQPALPGPKLTRSSR